MDSKIQLSLLEDDFVDKSSLKLKAIDQSIKDQIRKFYFSLKINKIAFNAQETIIKDHLDKSIEKQQSHFSEIKISSGHKK